MSNGVIEAKLEAKIKSAKAGTRTLASPEASRQLIRDRPVSLLLPIFLIFLLIPISFYIGSVRLTPYRLLLLLMIVPCFIAWTSGALGKVQLPDFLFCFFSLWGTVALIVNSGFDAGLKSGGILLIETFGTYLLARKLIRTPEQFEAMVRWLFWLTLLLLPFAVYESITSHKVILQFFRSFANVFPDAPTALRWGLARAQGPFEHPILFGVFCATNLSLSYFVLGFGKVITRRIVPPAIHMLGAFFSFSSGPLVAVAIQLIGIIWDRATQHVPRRWTILFLICASFYGLIALLAKYRTPIEVLIGFFAFDRRSAYSRILIWQSGSAEVIRHPLFGVGLGDWEHTGLLSNSLDMFWLRNAVSFGLPAGLSFACAVILILARLGRMKIDDPKLSEYRKGFIIAIAGVCVAGWSVHFWNAAYVTFMFLLGSANWMRPIYSKSDRVPLRLNRSMQGIAH